MTIGGEMKGDHRLRATGEAASASSQFEELLLTDEVCGILRITRDTMYEWREVDTAPPAIKLPNGHLRFPAGELLEWLKSRRCGDR